MELGLSLGDPSKTFGFIGKARNQLQMNNTAATSSAGNSLGFCMALGINSNRRTQEPDQASHGENEDDDDEEEEEEEDDDNNHRISSDPPVQLNLLPLAPVPRHIPWSSDNGSSEGGSSGNVPAARGFNRMMAGRATEEATSPNSVASSYRMDFCIYRGGNVVGSNNNKRDFESIGNDAGEAERASSRASDEDENGISRKKLRLSKEQSAYLEESFKEHNTLNPKQKLALAKQLNLRPRQVEVWFQNRRARTKLKQTEVDCEYLKRCCETLTEENRRLNKELQELRALKSSNPFYMQLPATTLTMCPSCERVATTTTAGASATAATTGNPLPLSSSRPKFYPFSHTTPPPPPNHQPQQSAPS